MIFLPSVQIIIITMPENYTNSITTNSFKEVGHKVAPDVDRMIRPGVPESDQHHLMCDHIDLLSTR